MWTRTLNVPSSAFLISSASSRSLAVGGSIVNTRSALRSSRDSSSRSGILLVSHTPMIDSGDSRPWKRGKALDGEFVEFLSWEIAVLEQSTSLYFSISNRTKLLDKCTEGMERGTIHQLWPKVNNNEGSSHWPSLDGSDKQSLRVGIGIIDKVRRSLFGRDSNKWNTFIGRFEPDNSRFGLRFIPSSSSITFSFPPLDLLLFFGSSR